MRRLTLGISLGVLAQIACSSHPRIEIGRIPHDLPIGEAIIDNRYRLHIDATNQMAIQRIRETSDPEASAREVGE